MANATQYSVDDVMIDVHASSKKQLFQLMAERIAELPEIKDLGLKCRDIVNATMERERLGSTGVGSGVALPHARIDGLERVYAIMARLETPMDYESVDEVPVDLVMLLVAPSDAGGAHLRALAQFSRRLRREETRQRLRSAPDEKSLMITITQSAQRAA
jgi:PTS system nitrogen regulatory IIA component